MRQYILDGIKDAVPIMLGYIPIGIAFGVLSSSIGISPLGVVFISLVLFAGSAQFITVSMIASFASGISIIATVFVVNFRHFLMSSSYSKYLKKERIASLLLLSYFITDESFAVGINTAKYDDERFNKWYLFGVELSGYFTWALMTFLGSILGGYIVDFKTFGLDFALPAMFIGLLALLIKNNRDLFVALLAGVITLGLHFTSLASFSVIIGSFVAALLMVGLTHD
jgi:4-azaleucine resistance transporter AzlC